MRANSWSSVCVCLSYCVLLCCVLLCCISLCCACCVVFRSAVFRCAAFRFAVFYYAVFSLRCVSLPLSAYPGCSCMMEHSPRGLGGRSGRRVGPRGQVSGRHAMEYKKGGPPSSLFFARQLCNTPPCLVPTIRSCGHARPPAVRTSPAQLALPALPALGVSRVPLTIHPSLARYSGDL